MSLYIFLHYAFFSEISPAEFSGIHWIILFIGLILINLLKY